MESLKKDFVGYMSVYLPVLVLLSSESEESKIISLNRFFAEFFITKCRARSAHGAIFTLLHFQKRVLFS